MYICVPSAEFPLQNDSTRMQMELHLFSCVCPNAAPTFRDPQMVKEFTTQPRSSAFIQIYPYLSITFHDHISDEVECICRT